MNSNQPERLPAVVDMGRMPSIYSQASFNPNGFSQDDQTEDTRLPLTEYLGILRRYRWRILAFCVAACAVTLIISARLTPIYESTATIDIDRQTPPGVVGQEASRAATNDSDQFLATQIRLVQSDSVLRPVDQRFELRRKEKQTDATASARGEAAPVVLRNLRVTRPPNTYLLLISYRSSDPQLAADASNSIAQSYLEHAYNIRLRSSASLSTFMERQLEELKAKMERSGLAVAAFERELNLINPEERTNILASRLIQLNTDYIRQEFLGEIRCLVFDVTPVNLQDAAGRFNGRMWVEDRDYSIVRFDGTYVAVPLVKGEPPGHFFHFDSWRVNVVPGEWAPAQIYVEEAGAHSGGEFDAPSFKAQTRFWAYAAAPTNKLDELTKILIENESGLKDQETSKDDSPLESQRKWEKQAEDNLLSRFQSGGFLAAPGPVDDVLNTVVGNLIGSASLGIDAHCRVLLTTPIETFSIGHTIVISRGLIDVLPDEASLAMVLADELAHIALGHRTPTQFAFHNQTRLSDTELLQRVRLERTPQEMLEAGKKTIEIMRASPYQKMSNAGLFLKALSSRGIALPGLLAANIGNQVANVDALSRLAEFTETAPALDEQKLEQIAALPLGSRVKVNPWNDQLTLVKTRPVALLSAREKMPFEITPFVLYLTRVENLAAK